jgi:hypothetical protein
MSDKEKIENQNTESIASQTNEEMNETISSVETIEHPETEITTSDIITSDTQNMETHAHELHKAPGHGWKHYFFEFLMLFIAVFCGFLAENLREHMVEEERATVFAATLYEELKKDTAGINKTMQNIRINVSKLDSLCLLSKETSRDNVTTGMLYYYASYTTEISFYGSENTTIDQLKSSGNLRLMGNEISQKINVYGKQLNMLENEYQLTRPEFAKIEELYFKIFDGYITFPRENFPDSVLRINLPFVDDNPRLMLEFVGWLKFEIGIYLSQLKDHLVPIKETAAELLELLKTEYHFE